MAPKTFFYFDVLPGELQRKVLHEHLLFFTTAMIDEDANIRTTAVVSPSVPKPKAAAEAIDRLRSISCK